MSKDSMALLEQKCSKMILDCVDWRQIDPKNDKETIQNVGNTYDLLYQVYCAKLTEEGSDYSSERDLRNFIKNGKEKRQNESLSFKSSKRKSSSWYSTDEQLIKWIFAGFILIVVFIYYLVLYFTVFDTSDKDEENLHRQARMRQLNRERNLQRAQSNSLPQ